jgi:light-regulated signal transduction histidine kinase (bacteriophytochrome)
MNKSPFGDCKNAVLQHLGAVQANGVLVAINSDNSLIEYCSANSAVLLGIEPESLLGRTGAEWLSKAWPRLRALADREGKLEWCEFAGVDPLVAIGHRQGAHRILEFERAVASQTGWWNHSGRTRFVEQLTSARTPEHCRELLVDWVYERSGYDRVMMYRFR